MGFRKLRSQMRTLRKGDPKFMAYDEVSGWFPRAGWEISTSTPEQYQMVIKECIANGWLKPVAFVKEAELMWEELQA